MVVNEESRHVVVLRRGQFCESSFRSSGVIHRRRWLTESGTDWFDCLDSQNRPCLTDRQIQKNLEAIVADADKTPWTEVAQNAVGLLTTENRKIWSSLRQNLIQSNRNNAQCLSVVDSALFMVCLDDKAPQDLATLCGNFLCGSYEMVNGVQVGTCTNRWCVFGGCQWALRKVSLIPSGRVDRYDKVGGRKEGHHGGAL
jgi:carnitine O-acetyltransferase